MQKEFGTPEPPSGWFDPRTASDVGDLMRLGHGVANITAEYPLIVDWASPQGIHFRLERSALDVSQARTTLSFPGVITPTALSANTDNYAPTGGDTAHTWRVSASAAYNLTGMGFVAEGMFRELINVGTETITLKNNVTSTAANRFLMDADYSMPANTSAWFWYDNTTARWRLIAIGKATSGTGGTPGGATGDVQLNDGASGFTASADINYTDPLFTIKPETAATNSAINILTIGHNSSGTPAAGFGLIQQYQLETSTTASTDVARQTVTWATATHASRAGQWTLGINDSGGLRDVITAGANGSAGTLGFFGVTPAIRQASQDLGTALNALGLTSGTSTFGAANLTGTIDQARLPTAHGGSSATLGVVPEWIRISFSYTDFQAAATTKTVTVYSAPAGTSIISAIAKTKTVFASADVVTMTMSLGYTSAAYSDYLMGYNLLTAVSNTNYSTDGVSGPVMLGLTFAATDLKTVVTYSGATNLNSLTAGAVDIFLLVAKLTPS